MRGVPFTIVTTLTITGQLCNNAHTGKSRRSSSHEDYCEISTLYLEKEMWINHQKSRTVGENLMDRSTSLVTSWSRLSFLSNPGPEDGFDVDCKVSNKNYWVHLPPEVECTFETILRHGPSAGHKKALTLLENVG